MNAQNTLPRLRVGAGASDGTSGLCAMQVVSWENGDTKIIDCPECADPLLALLVQNVNDEYCTHTATTDRMLCPPCSVDVLALAHRTVGTALSGWSDRDRRRVYVTIAIEQAESVLHLTDNERSHAACALVRQWLAGESIARHALYAAIYFAHRVADNASHAASASAASAVDPVSASAASGARAAIYAADADADIYADTDVRMRRAHHIINRFEELTGLSALPVTAETTEHATAQMLA